MSVATIVRQFGPAYVARFGAAMPASHRRAMEDLAACRTIAMGGHVTQCDACGHEHFVYHSCRNRSCPSCHGVSTRAWLAARHTELLPVPYFHVVFTLPAELRAIVRTHQRVLLGALMQTAAEMLRLTPMSRANRLRAHRAKVRESPFELVYGPLKCVPRQGCDGD